MKISALYTYPIKSLRATALDSAVVTKHGFEYDRRFMILEVQKDDNGKTTYMNMHVAHYPEMVLFLTSLRQPTKEDGSDGNITVTYQPPRGSGKDEKTLSVPLVPATGQLQVIDVEMHKSPTKAYKMPAEYNDWLSSCFGFDVILAYLGEHLRPVLMSTSANRQKSASSNNAGGWLSSITSTASSFIGGQENQAPEEERVTFADCAPYLVVSEKSMEGVFNRLPAEDKAEFDLIKFRPNIVVSGASEVWEEDYWGEVTIGGKTKIDTAQNCGRCKSINIDYATGQPGTGEAGNMLKKMMSDRRVDKGTKWNPIFGRYSFLAPGSDGNMISVGDEVVVSKKNAEHTDFGKCSIQWCSLRRC